MPEKFGGGAVESTITPVSLTLLIIAGLLILCLPRKYVIVALLAGIFFIPPGNIFVLAGAHLLPARVLSLIGLLRLIGLKLISGGPIYRLAWDSLDTIFAAWAIWRSVAVILLWQTPAAVTLECGHLWSNLLMYLVLRALITDADSVSRTIKTLSIVMIVSSVGMLYEHLHNQNLFGIYLGGLETAPSIRGGSIRAQGLFRHAILGGSFGATLIPLVLGLWKTGKSAGFAVLSLAACLIGVVASSSSTPVGALGAAVVGLGFWPLRKYMRLVRWGIVISLLVLNMVMKAPVWFIFSHISFVPGSTADFRSHLIDEFIRHFSDWWLIGIKDSNNWGESMWDYSNQFVAEGLTGGLLGISLFIWMIKKMFSKLGDARKTIAGSRSKEWFFWLVGCTVFAHINAWFGVSYWDNTVIAWFALIVVTSTVTRVMTDDTATEFPHSGEPHSARENWWQNSREPGLEVA